jgi:hypothetical protein
MLNERLAAGISTTFDFHSEKLGVSEVKSVGSGFACWRLRGIAAALTGTAHIRAETECDLERPESDKPGGFDNRH